MSDPTLVALVERLRQLEQALLCIDTREAHPPCDYCGVVIGRADADLVREAADALSRPVAAPLSANLPEALCRALHAKGWNVVDCETVERLARDILAVAAPPEGTLTREQAETRLTDALLGDAAEDRTFKAMRKRILAALFPHDGSRA